ncbi:hypothetical protein THARTR1_04794 [Trichoderma harzianum]|uniref:Uncharacterized protein n=1 Tax=Trichoderma harzianum TaxID=5544 RepID=A0A2K0UBE7_TRIHA|nr:hypothetical protein THARTR1_04794 [Trichoderma harzianum]
MFSVALRCHGKRCRPLAHSNLSKAIPRPNLIAPSPLAKIQKRYAAQAGVSNGTWRPVSVLDEYAQSIITSIFYLIFNSPFCSSFMSPFLSERMR